VDPERFATLTRALSGMLSRRTVAGALGLSAAGLSSRVEARKKRKKHCGPCKKRKKGKCKPKPNGAPCGADGTCQAGECQEPPPDPTCAETCDGCCDGSTCAPGDANSACGQGGDSCADCTPQGSCCGGACCDGCCFQGHCYPGNAIELCGSGGVACAECPIEEICNVDRVCAPPTCGNGGPCLVFVTGGAAKGDFGGLTGADEACQYLADAYELPGTYKAWLSDETGSPSTRFMRSPGPYQLVNETIIASNWADLTSGSLHAPINRTEANEEVTVPDGLAVWTNTKTDGTLKDAATDCERWTSETSSGRRGWAGHANSDWTDWDGNVDSCANTHRLYCFQQR
jgi:hypothetical protein